MAISKTLDRINALMNKRPNLNRKELKELHRLLKDLAEDVKCVILESQPQHEAEKTSSRSSQSNQNSYGEKEMLNSSINLKSASVSMTKVGENSYQLRYHPQYIYR